MSPNFWGCRCCGRQPTNCIFRVLDSDGNQLWTWRGHDLHYSSFRYRPEGFAVGSDGRIVHVGGVSEPLSAGLISDAGVSVWNGVSSVDIGQDGLRCPAIDEDGNLYATALVGFSLRLISYDSSGNLRFSVDLSSSVNSALDGVVYGGGKVWVIYDRPEYYLKCFDTDGNLESTSTFLYADDRNCPFGQFTVLSTGEAFVPFVGPDGGAVEIINPDGSLLDTYLTPNFGSFAFGSYGIRGIGVLSDGRVAAGFVYSGSSRGFHDLTNDTSLFSFSSSGNQAPWNCRFDGNGRIYWIDYDTSPSVSTNTIICCDEAGTELWRLTETEADLDVNQVYTPHTVSCTPDRLIVATPTPRPVTGYTVTPTP